MMVTDTISFLLSVASLIFTLIIYKSQSESEINRLYWCLQQNQLWNLKNVFEQYKKIIDTKDITVLADTVNKMLNFMLDAGELIEKQSRIIKMYHPIMNRLVSETNKLDHVLWLHIKAECDALVDDRITRGVHTNDIYKDTEELRKRVINLYFRLYGYNKSGGYTSYSMQLMSIIERNNVIISGVTISTYRDFVSRYVLRYIQNLLSLSWINIDGAHTLTSVQLLEYYSSNNTNKSKNRAYKNYIKHNKKVKEPYGMRVRLKRFFNHITFYYMLIIEDNINALAWNIIKVKDRRKEKKSQHS